MARMKKHPLFLLLSILLFSLFGCREISVSDNNTAAEPADISGISIAAKQMAAATATSTLTVTEEMIDTGIQNPGSLYRLTKVMERAAGGEDITIAYIGGSITDGSGASPQETCCYAYLSTQWWKDTFPDAAITCINAGIGATDSYLGVHRLQDDVLAYHPDLVITEFSVNDYRSWNKETYESLLRSILNSENEPAVISLLLGTKQEYNYAVEHAQAAFKLNVSTINYAAVLSDGMASGAIPWEAVGNPDGVHPNNEGHALIACLLTNFYRDVLSAAATATYPVYTVPEDKLTKSRYENADLLYASDIMPVSMEGFSEAAIPSALSCTDGWTTDCAGSISFEVTCREAGIVYYQTTDGCSGQYDVFVDNAYVTTIDADYKNGWGNCCDYVECFKNDLSETHLITLKPAEDSTGTSFAICGICVGY